ncbi:uncharacterized protein [Henckelia pumila]|uniref:uncharacterized protein n=1 Tax=Henckelia pumila TaxID=405737 RepID=UPI003C6DE26B
MSSDSISSESNKSDMSGKNSGTNSGTIASLSGGDASSLQITAHKLNGQNYLQWAQSVKIVICGRGKLGYLIGDLSSPKTTDPSYKTWTDENSIVLACLVNSMEPNISRRYLWFETAKDVWDAARMMYSDFGNASQIFEIRSKLKELKQGHISVTQYFSDLQDLWQELDLFLDANSLFTDCSVKNRKASEKERVFNL